MSEEKIKIEKVVHENFKSNVMNQKNFQSNNV